MSIKYQYTAKQRKAAKLAYPQLLSNISLITLKNKFTREEKEQYINALYDLTLNPEIDRSRKGIDLDDYSSNISCCFVFAITRQGHNFWMNLHKRLRNL